MTIGEKIKTARELANLSQQELADKVGTSRVSICYWENGRSETIRTKYLPKLARALHLDLYDLLDEDAPMTIVDKKACNELESNLFTMLHHFPLERKIDIYFELKKEYDEMLKK